MVKIRYSELPAGLHVAASPDHQGTVVYLQPGLTPAQRRAALFRVRSSARIGQGPTLPRREMARAIAADRVRTSARVGAAATRRHPMLCLTPVIVLVISAIAVMFMTVKPLPVAAQGRVAASIPTFRLGMQNHGQQRHGYSARTAAGPAAQSRHPQAVQSRAACTTRLPSSGRWPFLTPPSRPELPASFTSRCMRLRPFKRWLTHLP